MRGHGPAKTWESHDLHKRVVGWAGLTIHHVGQSPQGERASERASEGGEGEWGMGERIGPRVSVCVRVCGGGSVCAYVCV